MLKCEKGIVKVTGESIQVMSELASLINVLYKSNALTYEEILEIVIIGLTNNEELKDL